MTTGSDFKVEWTIHFCFPLCHVCGPSVLPWLLDNTMFSVCFKLKLFVCEDSTVMVVEEGLEL